jgi:hypothetical protein
MCSQALEQTSLTSSPQSNHREKPVLATFAATHNENCRSADQVFLDHLHEAAYGTVETDLARNYAENVVILTDRGIFRGHGGLRSLTQLFDRELPDATFRFNTTFVEGEVAFLKWTAESDCGRVADGIETFFIRDGRICAQTTHYTITGN